MDTRYQKFNQDGVQLARLINGNPALRREFIALAAGLQFNELAVKLQKHPAFRTARFSPNSVRVIRRQLGIPAPHGGARAPRTEDRLCGRP